jgi:hypothetical protein
MNWLRKVQIIVACCLLSCKVLTARDTTSRWYTPTEMSVHYGFDLVHQIPHFNVTNFTRLAPGNINFNPGDLPFKSKNSYAAWSGRPNFLGVYSNSFSILLGHEFSGKKKRAPKKRFRYGFTYLSSQGFTIVNVYEKRKHVDSAVYSWGTIYSDSVTQNYAFLEYISDHLRIDLSLLLESKHKKRLNYYGGIGISGGISLNQRVLVINENLHFKQLYGYYSSGLMNNPMSTPYQSLTSYSASVYIPLGFDIRLSKRNTSNQSTRIYLELQPSLNTMHIPGVVSYSIFALHSVFGLRTTF